MPFERKRIDTDDYSGADRRNGNGVLPWWVRAIAVVGIPGALALYLVYVGAQLAPRILATAEAAHSESIRTRELLREHIQSEEQMYRLLQRICSNAARGDDDRQRCFDK